MNDSKAITWSLIITLIGGITIGWIIARELGIANGASSTPELVVWEPEKELTIFEKYDSEKYRRESLDILVSKYAQLYDSCRFR